MINEIREQLAANADPEYKKFHQSLVPGLTSMIGVRMPKLRQISKWAAKQEWQKDWDELSDRCYEELMVKGILIGYGKLTHEEQEAYLKKFVPKINNWAVCDCCCSTWKFMKKDSDFWFDFLRPYLQSDNEFEVRFAVVAILDHFIEEKYLEEIFSIFDGIRHEGYYVKMAVAWAVSVCYVRFPERTWTYLEQDHLDAFTHNKAIQKTRESYRVSPEDKQRLLSLKKQETKNNQT